MDLQMTPMNYAREWYADKVDGFVRIANALIAEGITDDTKLAHELHEWLNAADSFMSFDEGGEVAHSMLLVSFNDQIAGDWQDEDDSQYPYHAAHAFIADVMVKLGRSPGPYLD
jgi:hypothetical protein